MRGGCAGRGRAGVWACGHAGVVAWARGVCEGTVGCVRAVERRLCRPGPPHRGLAWAPASGAPAPAVEVALETMGAATRCMELHAERRPGRVSPSLDQTRKSACAKTRSEIIK